MRRSFLIILSLALGCRAEPGVPPSAAEADASARAAMAHYSRLLNGSPPNADSVAAQFAPTGELLGGGGDPVRGPDAVRAFLSSFGKVQVDSAVTEVTASTVSGDRVTLWGTFSQRAVLGSGAPLHPHGRFVAEWVRDASGRWLIQRMLTAGAP